MSKYFCIRFGFIYFNSRVTNHMILENKNIVVEGLKFKLQLVDKSHIYKSYMDHNVDSCMTGEEDTKWYQIQDNCKMIRILYKNTLYLRALMWHAKDKAGNLVKYVDRVYHSELSLYPDEECINHPRTKFAWDVWCCDSFYSCPRRENKEYIDVYEKIFKPHWKELGDVRSSNKKLFVDIKLPKRFYNKEYEGWNIPHLDSFNPNYKAKQLVMNYGIS